MLLLLLMFDLLSCSNADTFSLVVPDGDTSGHLGSSVVLPCGLSTALDIRSYEVRWYRPNKKENPILLYKDLKVQENAGAPQYRGRVSLIGELQKGNVSLKLENLTVADRGEYLCYVKSYKWYEEASVFLRLPVVGSPLLLSFAEAGEQVNVTCASGGWSPKPTLTWRDRGGRELTDSVNYDYTDPEGLVNVSSWLLLSPSESEWISCSVGLSDQEMRESRVLPLKSVHHPATKTDSTTEPGVSPGWKVATILLVISLLVLTVVTIIFLKFRGHIFKKGTTSTPAEEEACRLVDPETAHTEKSNADFSPPPCPVCAVREINRTDGGTQTSGPETAKETSTDEEIQGPEADNKKAITDTEIKDGEVQDMIGGLEEMSISGGASNPSAGPETADKETNADTEIQADLSRPSYPVCTLKETNRTFGATQTSACSGTTGRTQGEVDPPLIPVSAVRETNRPDGATQTSVQEPDTQGTSTNEQIQGPQAANNNTRPDNEIQGEGSSPSTPVSAVTETNRTEGATQASDWEKMLVCKVTIKPVSSNFPLGTIFKERMSSGQYYWEVTGLTGQTATTPSSDKRYKCPTSWYVGVTIETAEKRRKVLLTPQNGYWVLHYDGEKGYYVNDPSQTPVLVRDRFSKLGVFLDCDEHKLSFYDCDKQTHLYTFYGVPSTSLIPLLYPGLKPRYTLEISQTV
ncbi:butyrophilin subfamily 2 member A2-like isoform X5 [Colossoma macropomum]|uniref:butyrophilin subfamily 2 member A2-like isoform X5 n=1 Tax=Colossoma macropomum TaxID=42526 RepID=UPI00186545A0|nr:butyrophilin subfamily 2 member A2-like isoform X5 [Colossoma macropomum]